jgi:hypothetical protein
MFVVPVPWVNDAGICAVGNLRRGEPLELIQDRGPIQRLIRRVLDLGVELGHRRRPQHRIRCFIKKHELPTSGRDEHREPLPSPITAR